MNNVVGERIKAIRTSIRMTQEEFAEHAKIGRPNLARYETGKNEPSLSALLKIAETAGVSLDYLTGRSDSPAIPEPVVSAARPTEGMAPVTDERMKEIVREAYFAILQSEQKK